MESDPATPQLRASDGEREQAVGRLRDGAADGRLTLDELAGRVEHAYQARTQTELARLTADLAAPTEQSVSVAPAARRWTFSLLGGTHRAGRFRLAARSASVSLIGGTHLDLRQAELEGTEVEITQVSLIGGMHITVPDAVHVEVSGVSLIGGHHVEPPDRPPGPGAPVVHIRDFSLIGGVYVGRPRKGSPVSSTTASRASRRARRRLHG